jgi:signal transduction histidine kinase
LICNDLKEKMEIQNLNNVDKMKDLMITTISHEFNTPLNGIIMLLDALIREKKIPPSIVTQYLKPAKNCSDILLNLIRDFIDYTKLNLD